MTGQIGWCIYSRPIHREYMKNTGQLAVVMPYLSHLLWCNFVALNNPLMICWCWTVLWLAPLSQMNRLLLVVSLVFDMCRLVEQIYQSGCAAIMIIFLGYLR
jgi:hypothetical protein